MLGAYEILIEKTVLRWERLMIHTHSLSSKVNRFRRVSWLPDQITCSAFSLT